jgi:hypothetical protein
MFFLLFKRKTKEKTLWVIFFYVVFCGLNELFGLYLYRHHIDASADFAVFTVIEFIAFCVFYYFAIPSLRTKITMLALGIFLSLFALLDYFVIDTVHSFDSRTSGFESILIILMCIYYLGLQLKGNKSLFEYSTSNFWVIITFLIYLAGIFFVYIMAGNMTHDKKFVMQYIVINSSFNVLKNILLSVAMLMKPAPKENKSRINQEWDGPLSFK